MSFRAKRIFLAEDHEEARARVKQALIDAGHDVVMEESNGTEALAMLTQAVEQEIEVLVTDGMMPDEGDGQKLASELNKLNPNLLVVSISSGVIGNWEDPNYDPERPHPQNRRYDINGRTEYRYADLTAHHVYWDFDELARQIGELEFSLADKRSLENIESGSSNRERG